MLFVSKKRARFENTFDYIQEAILGKSSTPFRNIKSINWKQFWIYFLCFGTKLGIILEASRHVIYNVLIKYFNVPINNFTEFVCIIICSFIFFCIAKFFGFVIIMLLLKHKYVKN